jgi:hypothetical protein
MKDLSLANRGIEKMMKYIIQSNEAFNSLIYKKNYIYYRLPEGVIRCK